MKFAMFLASIAFSLTASFAQSASAQKPPPADDPIDRAMELIGPDPAAARRLVEPLADSGHAEAMNMLAMLVENDGPSWKADPIRAEQLREGAIKAGSKAAALNVALRLLYDSAGDHPRAIELLRQAESVELLQAPVAHAWARAYLFGYGVERDLKAGTQHLLRAVVLDPLNVDAQFLLGRAYQNGWGIEPDPALAYQHMRIAADRGDERAQWHAATMLLQGQGVAVNQKEAYVLVAKSSEAGYLDGMISRAVMLAAGEGVTENDVEALSWYAKAAGERSAHGMRGLGYMLVTGEGGAPDAVRGFALLELAADAGEANAIKLLQMFREQGEPDRRAIDAAKADWIAQIGPPKPVR